MGKKQQRTFALGRALANDREVIRSQRGKPSKRHSQPDIGQSVTDQSSLDEFLSTAVLAGTEFTAERQNITIVPTLDSSHSSRSSVLDDEKMKRMQRDHRDFLRIPRRPPWNTSMTTDELEQLENETFLEWRRGLAELQKVDNLVITPFERNLDFWRQLWRVVERSDVVLQIVDARNPLLFRCHDLERYVQEVNPLKKCILLVNKADLLTQRQRKEWAHYFENNSIHALFFSSIDPEVVDTMDVLSEAAEDLASSPVDVPDNDSLHSKDSDQNVDDDPILGREGDFVDAYSEIENGDDDDDSGGEGDDDDDDDDDWETADEDSDEGEHSIPESNGRSIEGSKRGNRAYCNFNCPDVLTCDELLEQLRVIRDEIMKSPSFEQPKSVVGSPDPGSNFSVHKFTVGLVGYPNVGKSSMINRLLGHKKVPVSATPGKTKHFQTLQLEDNLVLCDCPGLVMPSFAMSREQMLCLGILPIDQMRDPTSAIGLICDQIPRALLERLYGIILPAPREGEPPGRPPTPQELLTVYAYSRGFMGPKGTTDWGRAGRVILKDYLNGRLRYCYPPPHVDETDFNAELGELGRLSEVAVAERRLKSHAQLDAITRHRLLASGRNSKVIDSQFFQSREPSYHVKLRSGVGGGAVVANGPASEGPSKGSSLSIASEEKSWKKHNNRKKKEKLRRVYRDLDYS